MYNNITKKGGNYMAISSEKVRILITLPVADKEKLEKIAKDENRSISNFVYTLIRKELEKRDMR